MGFIFLVTLIFAIIAARKGWFHWEKCTASAMAGSMIFKPRVLMVYRILLALYCFSILLWLLARPEGQYG